MTPGTALVQLTRFRHNEDSQLHRYKTFDIPTPPPVEFRPTQRHVRSDTPFVCCTTRPPKSRHTPSIQVLRLPLYPTYSLDWELVSA
jgi:hypothetical protein